MKLLGTDFAGVLQVEKRAAQVKARMTLFACTVTTAAHLELVLDTDMAIENYLRSFHQFVTHRELCKIVYPVSKRPSEEPEQFLERPCSTPIYWLILLILIAKYTLWRGGGALQATGL